MDLRTIKTLTPREYHAHRAASKHAAREARRERILELTRAAICRVAPRFPAVRRVFLFGSVLRPGRFHDGSDIDVALVCDDLESETPFARALERETMLPIDLRPFTGAIVDAVRDSGEKVYG